MEMIKDQNPDEEFLEQVRRQTQKVMEEFLTAAKMKPGQVLVVGCSSSEIGRGRKIFCVYGKNSSLIRNRYV